MTLTNYTPPLLDGGMIGVLMELIQPPVTWMSQPMCLELAVGVTDRFVYLALEGLMSRDVISESDNVAKCVGALPGYVICQWRETSTC